MKKTSAGLDNFIILDSENNYSIPGIDFSFPFKSCLSFDKLIDHIQLCSDGNNSLKKNYAESIIAELKKAPELYGRITDKGLLEKHKNLIDNMMMFVFPDAFRSKQLFAASSPFMHDIFYTSENFKNIIRIVDGKIEGEKNIDETAFQFGSILNGYIIILNTFYGLNLNIDFPIVYKVEDEKSGLHRYFKINMAGEFIDIKLKGELKKLSEEDLENVRSNIYDLNYISKIIEPENFEFTGFLVMNAINITDTEILSAIKKDLIKKDSLTTLSGFLKIQHKLKSLMRCPGLLLGLTDYPGNKEKLFKFGKKIGNSFLLDNNLSDKLGSLEGSIYDFSFESKKIVIIENLLKLEKKTKIEEAIIESGMNNIIIAPLVHDEKITGILELGSPGTGMLNMINALKLYEVLPLFAMAVERNREEFKSKVRNVIREKCTAVHPTLEWKFEKAAVNFLYNNTDGSKADMEDIVFSNVYPLYGMSDIRNSSLKRNSAISEDLIENLGLAVNVLMKAKKHKGLHKFDELIYKVEKKIASLKFGIDSGEEAQILRFLENKIVPLFSHIEGYNKNVKKEIDHYRNEMDVNLGFVYRKRKNYEQSATRINNVISLFLDEEQKKIQKIYPHYFERYKTDGVEHSIYIGSSLVENIKFDKLYLKNIRLWQLLIMSEIVKKTDMIKNELSIPLETAHLILVQDTPLSIRFRYDEKRFDVDGAYNISYEIMKKRIDKAEIKGKKERLTQPGKIAIIFSQNSELQEYSEYIEYLQSKNILKKNVEEHDIEELQGIKGLKALRVEVEKNNKSNPEVINLVELKKVAKKMSLN